jgi:prephenate dehydratase
MSKPPVLPVAFPGAPGAYSQEAARLFFDATYPTLTCGSSADAVQAVCARRASHAVVPVENSITGAFAGVPEALRGSVLVIVGEVDLAMRHCLLGAPGARLDELAVVRSHPTALAQCRDWLAGWGVATRPASDTAEAARELSRTGDAALGVIGSGQLARMYGLDVLAEGIADRPDNRTRFYVLGTERAGERGVETTTRSALLASQVGGPRAMKTLRIQLESRGATRARTPFLGSEDGAEVLIEFDHPAGAGRAIAAGAANGLHHRWLGSWTPERRPANAARRDRSA